VNIYFGILTFNIEVESYASKQGLHLSCGTLEAKVNRIHGMALMSVCRQ